MQYIYPLMTMALMKNGLKVQQNETKYERKPKEKRTRKVNPSSCYE